MQTLKATVRVSDRGIMQLALPEHAGEALEVLLVYQPAAIAYAEFWQQASQGTLQSVWDNDADNVYAELL
ncbi:MAG TPA: hypothetical protein DCQ32_10310 [Cyanobacteria bacterium UBA8156]|jgi:hypothetical protein|nr:hypothetical protein [Cyanobacteria bacterium UBA8156]